MYPEATRTFLQCFLCVFLFNVFPQCFSCVFYVFLHCFLIVHGFLLLFMCSYSVFEKDKKGVGKGSPKLTTTSTSGPEGVSKTDDDNCHKPSPPSAKNKTTTVVCAIRYPGHPQSNQGDEFKNEKHVRQKRIAEKMIN